MGDAWIVDVVRTPRGKGRADGGLHGQHPQALFGSCLVALAARTGFDPVDVDDVIAGNGVLSGEHGDDIRAPLRAPRRLARHRPRHDAQSLLRLGATGRDGGGHGCRQRCAGSRRGGRSRVHVRWDVGVGASTIDGANPALRERVPTVPQGISADLIATLEGFSRQDVDAFAVESQRRAAVAVGEGRFDRSLLPVTDANGEVVLALDEHLRPGTSMEALAKLRPAFAELGATGRVEGEDLSFDELCLARYPGLDRVEHVHHAGNSSGIVDGAAAALVASDRWVRAHGVAPGPGCAPPPRWGRSP